MIGMVKMRILEPDRNYRLRGEALRNSIMVRFVFASSLSTHQQEDKAMGMIPFFVSTTLGTTSACSFDRLDEIGPLASEFNLWLHVDAAYAGSAMICPEFRHLMNGIEVRLHWHATCK